MKLSELPIAIVEYVNHGGNSQVTYAKAEEFNMNKINDEERK
jgi:hypothetical protein